MLIHQDHHFARLKLCLCAKPGALNENHRVQDDDCAVEAAVGEHHRRWHKFLPFRKERSQFRVGRSIVGWVNGQLERVMRYTRWDGMRDYREGGNYAKRCAGATECLDR